MNQVEGVGFRHLYLGVNLSKFFFDLIYRSTSLSDSDGMELLLRALLFIFGTYMRVYFDGGFLGFDIERLVINRKSHPH